MMNCGTSPSHAVGAFLAVAFCVVSGCVGQDHWPSYAVDLKNLGTRRIYVEGFPVGLSPRSTVTFGLVMPGGTKGWNTVQERPRERLVLRWRDEETGVSNETELAIKVPPQFCAERGSAIRLNLNPDTNDVTVSYRVFDPKSEDFVEVDSSGRPVKIKPEADSTK